jgi:hypothetical protein
MRMRAAGAAGAEVGAATGGTAEEVEAEEKVEEKVEEVEEVEEPVAAATSGRCAQRHGTQEAWTTARTRTRPPGADLRLLGPDLDSRPLGGVGVAAAIARHVGKTPSGGDKPSVPHQAVQLYTVNCGHRRPALDARPVVQHARRQRRPDAAAGAGDGGDSPHSEGKFPVPFADQCVASL